MKPKEIIKLLHKDGWKEKHQVGSHIQLVHPTKTGKVTVPYHNKDLDPKTINSILLQARLK
jgi:predicted RNA binding protein YcfA (HicA-like mRNA interferase family)